MGGGFGSVPKGYNALGYHKIKLPFHKIALNVIMICIYYSIGFFCISNVNIRI